MEKTSNSKERERYLNLAIKEFEDAKVIAAALKDTDSIKWLDRQILGLTFKKQKVGEEKIAGTAISQNFVCP